VTRRPPFKIALIGASGLLGRAISNELGNQSDWQLVRTTFSRGDAHSVALDIRHEAAVRNFVAREAPDAIIVTAAERRPDICENDPALARALNVDAVRIIADAAKNIGAWVLSISTDYVFDGTQAPYQPGDAPSPLNAYGRSKLEGERALLESGASACVLRLPLLYGPVIDWSESAVTSLTPAIVRSADPDTDPALMDAWAIRYPTYTPDVALVVRQMLERHVNGAAITGIEHWSADEPMTKFQIAQHIAEVLNIPARLVAQALPADTTPRPRDCHLASERLDAMQFDHRTPFDQAIRVVLAGWPRAVID
jgi:dTDP-4-dehydrorhamnose reductase